MQALMGFLCLASTCPVRSERTLRHVSLLVWSHREFQFYPPPPAHVRDFGNIYENFRKMEGRAIVHT